MSTQTDRIKQAINCGRVLRDTFGGNVGGGPDVFAEALAALSELEAQPSQTKDLEAFFERLRFDKTRHIGLGDIRLTIADQDELLSLTRSVAQPSAPTVEKIMEVVEDCVDMQDGDGSSCVVAVLDFDKFRADLTKLLTNP